MANRLRHKLGIRYPTKPISLRRKPYKLRREDVSMEIIYQEKEKIKSIYRVSEKEIRRYVKDAIVSTGAPITDFLRRLETRLDNIVYRLGFTPDRRRAQRIIKSGHVIINGNKIDDISYHLGQRDVLEFTEKKHPFKDFDESSLALPAWLERKGRIGRMVHLPSYQELRQKDLDIKNVLEYYALL